MTSTILGGIPGMKIWLAAVAVTSVSVGATIAHAQGRGGTVRPELEVPPLPEEPIVFATAEHMDVRLVVLATGLEYPWSIGFLPNGDKLVVERPGRLRLIQDDVLRPEPVEGVPVVVPTSAAGLGDVVLHPDFESNRYIYLTYNKPGDDGGGHLAVARGVWRDDRLRAVEDIYESEDAGGIARLVFGPDDKIYVSTFVGGPPESAQDPTTLGGKVLRLNQDGSIPDDNPFVGNPDYRPEIFTLGHRTPSGLTVHPETATIYEVEMGPNGGDEVNLLVPGGNYGWPIVSLGRDYGGAWQSETFSEAEIEKPAVYWMPSISTSGLDFYTGTRLSAWTGDLFVGGMRYGEIAGTGQLHRIRFNEDMQEIRREILLADLRHRIRDVRQGPDELLYLLTDAEDGAVMRLEPAD